MCSSCGSCPVSSDSNASTSFGFMRMMIDRAVEQPGHDTLFRGIVVEHQALEWCKWKDELLMQLCGILVSTTAAGSQETKNL
jgi:hypothetical protein